MEANGPEHFSAVVIGGGQAGLATAYYLQQAGTNFVVLEAGERLGHTWRERWDSLHLETPIPYDSLPGDHAFPNPSGDKWYLPTKEECAAYLESYAEANKLPIRLGVKVTKLSKDGERFAIETNGGTITADQVVVATGYFRDPKLPEFAGQLDPSITQMHSSAYRNPGQLKDGDVLVVGAASSGSQIAMEIAATRKTFLAGRNVGNIPRRVPPGIGVNIFRVFPFVVTRTKTSFLGKKMYKEALEGGRPLVRFTYKDVKNAGVERVEKRVSGVQDGKPVLDDGTVMNVTNVVWATGWNPDYSWIDLPIMDDKGQPRQDMGVVEGNPGIYFVGIAFQHSESSALLFGVGRDAKYVTDQMVGANATAGAQA